MTGAVYNNLVQNQYLSNATTNPLVTDLQAIQQLITQYEQTHDASNLSQIEALGQQLKNFGISDPSLQGLLTLIENGASNAGSLTTAGLNLLNDEVSTLLKNLPTSSN